MVELDEGFENSSESLEDRYHIYVNQMIDLGVPAKTFDEWLNS